MRRAFPTCFVVIGLLAFAQNTHAFGQCKAVCNSCSSQSQPCRICPDPAHDPGCVEFGYDSTCGEYGVWGTCNCPNWQYDHTNQGQYWAGWRYAPNGVDRIGCKLKTYTQVFQKNLCTGLFRVSSCTNSTTVQNITCSPSDQACWDNCSYWSTIPSPCS